MGEHQVQKQHRRPSSKSPRALFLLPSQGALDAPTQLSHLSSEHFAVHMLHREATWRTQSTLLSLSQDTCPPIAAGKGLPLLPGPLRCPSFLGPIRAPLMGPRISFTHHMPLSRGGGGPRHGAHSVPTRCSPTQTWALNVGVLRRV